MGSNMKKRRPYTQGTTKLGSPNKPKLSAREAQL